MKEIRSRARYDWVIALATAFPILEGGGVTFDGGSKRLSPGFGYRQSSFVGLLIARARPQEMRSYSSCWSLRVCDMGRTRSKLFLVV